MCIYHIFFIHSSVDGHLGWFHNLAIMKSAAINMDMHAVRIPEYSDFISFGKIPRSVIAGSCGGSIPSLLTNLHTDLHSGCTNLQSHHQCIRVPISPHLCLHLSLLLFLMVANLTGVGCRSRDSYLEEVHDEEISIIFSPLASWVWLWAVRDD